MRQKSKKYSIVIMADNLTSSKEFVVSKKLIRNALIAISVLVLTFGFMIFDYLTKYIDISLDKKEIHNLKKIIGNYKNSDIVKTNNKLKEENEILKLKLQGLNNIKNNPDIYLNQVIALKKEIERLTPLKNILEKPLKESLELLDKHYKREKSNDFFGWMNVLGWIISFLLGIASSLFATYIWGLFNNKAIICSSCSKELELKIKKNKKLNVNGV